MAPLIFLFSLVLALASLNGWPLYASPWLQALIALGFLMIGIGALILLTPTSKARRFSSTRKPKHMDRWMGALCLFAACGLIYLALVYAPPATQQFSQYVTAVVQERLGSAGDLDSEEAAEPQGGQGAGEEGPQEKSHRQGAEA